jgi:hypothetical protein
MLSTASASMRLIDVLVKGAVDDNLINDLANGPENVFPGEYSAIPAHMRVSICRYILQRCPVGSFLEAVITNDLSGAVFGADDTNLILLKPYLMWFYNIAPMGCHASKENYKNWLASTNENWIKTCVLPHCKN